MFEKNSKKRTRGETRKAKSTCAFNLNVQNLQKVFSKKNLFK